MPSWQTDSAAAAQVYNTLKANPDLLQINWDNMLLANDQNFQTVNNADGVAGSAVSGKQALYLIENRVIQTSRLNFNTTFNTILNDNITTSTGLSFQKQTSRFYKEAEDLLGAEFLLILINSLIRIFRMSN